MPPSEPSANIPPPSLEELCDKAMNLQVAGRLGPAEEIYREILLAQPRHAAANHCLGILLIHVGRPGDGLPHLLTAVGENPQIPDYWLGCLEALLLLGQTDEAFNLLASARRNGVTGPAIEEIAQKLQAPRAASAPPHAPRRGKILSPSQQEHHIEALVKQGRNDEALTLARDLTDRHPKRGFGWKALGMLLAEQRDLEGALAAMQTAVRLMPQDAEALRNMGVAFYRAERFAESEDYLRRALKITPNSVVLHHDLGITLSSQARTLEAQTHLRRAIALTAHESTAESDVFRSSLLLGLSYDPSISAQALFAEHCRVGEHLEGPRASWPRHPNNPDPERRLQVGLVSGDLWNHSVASFIDPVLARLQKYDSVELHAYYNNGFEDAVSQRLRGYLKHWSPVLKLSDQQLAQQIRDDKIDVLIDLSGHTALNRLRAFARKPAPIQVSWIGYPGTTGMRAMDYYLADRHFLPPGQFDQYFTEKLAYLPANVPFQAFESAPPVNALPALASGRITFGSFNRFTKVNGTTVDLWSKLLREVPTAELLIAGMPPNFPQDQLIAQFAAAGVARDRIAFHPRCDMQTYLALHNHVDVCLDTYPYNGGTTTVHAIWMGVPTLTMVGPTPAGRQGAAMLGQLDLDGFIAGSAEDFAAKGRYWSENLAALATVRGQLRGRWQLSPARNPDVIVASLEQALRHMWKRWCANLPPESL